MPAIKEGPEGIIQSIEKHSADKLEPLEDTCLKNATEVEDDLKDTEDDMVKTVPFSVAIPNSNEEIEEEERFTPATEAIPTPAPGPSTPGLSTPAPAPTPAPEVLIPSRPSSASPSRLRSASKPKPNKSPEQTVTFDTISAPPVKDNVLNLYTAQTKRSKQKYLSFKDLTAEFDRILKPLMQQYSGYPHASSVDQRLYDTSGDCTHPVLAIEPRNPATPPRSLKIHKQRTVIKPGYTYSEPVLFDLPIDPDTITEQGIENVLEIAERMRPLPPRKDNFTHYPPSRHLMKPPYYTPIVVTPAPKVVRNTPPTTTPAFGRNSKCSSSSIKM